MDTGVGLNKIYNEDCLDVNKGMSQIKSKSIDMILCDLPYGTTANEWDSVLPLDLLWAEYKRIIKDDGAIVLTAQTPFDKVLGASNLDMLRYEWIWDKRLSTGFLNANKMPLKRHENVLVFYKKLPTYNPIKTKGEPYDKGLGGGPSDNYGEVEKVLAVNETGDRMPTSIIEFSNANKRGIIHPTQKPVKLFEYFIRTYTNRGDVVLDNCMGSGTTAVACINTKRNFIGYESNKEYYTKSLERIEGVKRKPKMLW